MKKLILGILCFWAMGISAQTYNYDVNGDGSKDMADLAFFINYLKSYISGTPAYDVNGDGKADINDVTCLQDYILGRVAEDAHEYVDLGLSVKWATCNIGADNVEDYGLYFAWGETTGYTSSEGHNFAWASYKFGTSSTALTKYCLTSNYGTVDGKTVLESDDDAACVNWGGNWRMPTYDEINELKTNCTMKLTTQNDVKGYKFTGSNGNSIFLPATGYFKGTTHLGETTYLGYWSKNLFGTQSGSDSRYAYCLEYCDEFNDYETDYRCRGFCIRPVCP